jgi:hypothetical protein
VVGLDEAIAALGEDALARDLKRSQAGAIDKAA